MATEPTRQRSGLVTAVGVVDLVFGGLSLICGGLMCLGGAFGAAVTASPELTKDLPPEQAKAVKEAGAMSGMVILKSVIYLGLAGGLIAAGIGVLKLASWGRLLSMGCAALAVVLVLIPPWDLAGLAMGLVINGAFAGFIIWALMQQAHEFS